MKINKIRRKKNNLYEITLSDNNSLSFYDDTIIKYNLLKPTEITEEKLKEIVEYNNEIDAYHKALKFITAKLRTRKEIRKKLQDYSKSVINKTIERLEHDGYLNDTLYIKSFIADQVNLTLNGKNKIKKELIKLEFNDQQINEFLDNYSDEVWEERVVKIINKKINSNHNLSKIMLINKIKRDLINMGYNNEIINMSLEKIDIVDDKKILEKEFLKELKKQRKKFEGEALKNKIKYNLYKKGFNMQNIDDLIYKLIDE